MKNIYDDTMNNNESNYEGNLAFPPQEESVEKKCEKLEKQLKIAVECLEIYASPEYKMVGMSNGVPCTFIISNTNNLAQKTLEQIKELGK